MLRYLAFGALSILMSCTEYKISDMFVSPEVAQASGQKTIHVFNANLRNTKQFGTGLGTERRDSLNFFDIEVLLPKDHKKGVVKLPKGRANLKTDFVAIQREPISATQSGATMLQNLNAFSDAVWRSTHRNEAFIYIHGYNTPLPRAIARVAQIKEDVGTQIPGIAFTWPSASSLRGYVYDRDSAVFSRDELETTIRALTDRPNKKLFVWAHSMGSFLTMEVLRQMHLRDPGSIRKRVNAIALVSPDIDRQVFESQLNDIGRENLPDEFFIFTNGGDLPLRLSSIITGGAQRIGGLVGADSARGSSDSDVAIFRQKYGTQVVPMDAFADEAGRLGHNIPTQSGRAMACISEAIKRRQIAQAPIEWSCAPSK